MLSGQNNQNPNNTTQYPSWEHRRPRRPHNQNMIRIIRINASSLRFSYRDQRSTLAERSDKTRRPSSSQCSSWENAQPNQISVYVSSLYFSSVTSFDTRPLLRHLPIVPSRFENKANPLFFVPYVLVVASLKCRQSLPRYCG